MIKTSRSIIVFSLTLIFLLSSSNTYAGLVTEGRNLLFNNGNPTYSDILLADKKFIAALAVNPDDPEANLFRALTRVAAFALENGSGGNFETLRDMVEAFGLTRNSNLFLLGNAPYDMPPELPDDTPSGEEVRMFLHEEYINLLNAILDNLAKVPSSYTTMLTPSETGDQAIEVDFGDVLLYKAVILVNKSLALILSSFNLNIDIDAIVRLFSDDQGSINKDILESYPAFLTLLGSGSGFLLSAETVLGDAIDTYLEASLFIRSEGDDQLDDLITIDPEELLDEEAFRQDLQTVKTSLTNNTVAHLKDLSFNLNPFFGYGDGPYDLRDFLPQFDQCNQPVNGTMGHGRGNDPTLGGILPEYTQADWHVTTETCHMGTSTPTTPLLNLLLLNK